MGNCLRNNKISAQNQGNYESTPAIEAPWREQKLEKKVRFKIENDVDEGDGGCHGNARSGTVRIRLVMTQEELKRMLSCKDKAQHTSLEQLLGAVKLRGGRISEVCDGEYDVGINSWRPALESIPENCLINLK